MRETKENKKMFVDIKEKKIYEYEPPQGGEIFEFEGEYDSNGTLIVRDKEGKYYRTSDVTDIDIDEIYPFNIFIVIPLSVMKIFRGEEPNDIEINAPSVAYKKEESLDNSDGDNDSFEIINEINSKPETTEESKNLFQELNENEKELLDIVKRNNGTENAKQMIKKGANISKILKIDNLTDDVIFKLTLLQDIFDLAEIDVYYINIGDKHIFFENKEIKNKCVNIRFSEYIKENMIDYFGTDKMTFFINDFYIFFGCNEFLPDVKASWTEFSKKEVPSSWSFMKDYLERRGFTPCKNDLKKLNVKKYSKEYDIFGKKIKFEEILWL